MDGFSVVAFLLLLSAAFVILTLLAVPLFFFLIKAKMDRTLSLLELIERRVGLLEAMNSGQIRNSVEKGGAQSH